jgi:hypothetical protein
MMACSKAAEEAIRRAEEKLAAKAAAKAKKTGGRRTYQPPTHRFEVSHLDEEDAPTKTEQAHAGKVYVSEMLR